VAREHLLDRDLNGPAQQPKPPEDTHRGQVQIGPFSPPLVEDDVDRILALRICAVAHVAILFDAI
jgi:hypothetical protein